MVLRKRLTNELRKMNNEKNGFDGATGSKMYFTKDQDGIPVYDVVNLNVRTNKSVTVVFVFGLVAVLLLLLLLLMMQLLLLLFIQEENTKENHNRVGSLYVIKTHVTLEVKKFIFSS